MYTTFVTTDVDNDVDHYLAGVVPRGGVNINEATTLLFRRGAVSVKTPNPGFIEATFAHEVVLRGLVTENDSIVTACSVTTSNMVYLIGALDVALRYVGQPAPEKSIDL